MSKPGDQILPIQYRKRPVVIEAIRWSGSNLKEVIAFTGLHPSAGKWTWEEYEQVVKEKGLKIFTLEGHHMASVGDWIIKGVKGEFYPCKPDIFLETYELAGAVPDRSPASAGMPEEPVYWTLTKNGLVKEFTDNACASWVTRKDYDTLRAHCSARDKDEIENQFASELLAALKRRGIDTDSWDGDEGMVETLAKHIAALRTAAPGVVMVPREVPDDVIVWMKACEDGKWSFQEAWDQLRICLAPAAMLAASPEAGGRG